MSIKLRELIRNVRAAKTAAEERAVVAKECALIRTAFRDEDNPNRSSNVSKLLFVHMLGYPSHFGRMECLKLIASPSFSDKRMGYLGLVILLEEDTDVLMLVTNSLKNDLNHSNQYVVGLACAGLGNIGSVEMVRGLTGELERMMLNSNPYIAKKASLCAIRVCQKVPELAEDLVEKLPEVLNDRNHGVLVAALGFMSAIMEQQPDYAKVFRKHNLTAKLVKMLKNLVLSGYAPEYDVSGITDPFLQVLIIKCLRYLGIGEDDAAEKMGDILAQVATNTETAKNAGNAILYETVKTIMAVPSAGGHKVLAINILGKFLLNKDNNIRYVALLSMAQVIATGDLANVVRHYDTIVSCLKDPDVSIRRRAMNLIYDLVNEGTVRQLGREMLSYLAMADVEEHADICNRVSEVLEKWSPTPRWHLDTLVAMFRLAGKSVAEHSEAMLAHIIAANADLQSYAVHTLYKAVTEEMHQPALTRAAVWTIGEYGVLLLTPCSDFPEATPITRENIVKLLGVLMKTHSADVRSKSRILNALAKLSSGCFKGTPELPLMTKLLGMFSSSMELELQKRSTEYLILGSARWAGIGGEIFKRMPVIDPDVIKTRRNRTKAEDEDDEEESEDEEVESPKKKKKAPKASTGTSIAVPGSAPTTKAAGGGLLDDLLGMGSAPSMPVAAAGGLDMLNDIFGSSMALPTAAPSAPASKPAGGLGMFDDLLGPASSPAPAPVASPPPAGGALAPLIVFEKNGISVTFNLKVPGAPAPEGALLINATYNNASPAVISEFVFLAAVPTFIKLQMMPASGSDLPPSSAGNVTQVIKIQNTAVGTKRLKMKCKLDFKVNGKPISATCDVEEFPGGL